ncbi:MAG: GNAT family N-acetyltransferase [Thermoprotei archaeon]
MEEVRVEKRGSVYVIRFDDGSKAWLSFKEENSKLYLLETYTPEQHRGKGYGAKLVEAAIKDAKSRGLKIVPVCSYSIYYFLKNRDAREVLTEEYARMSDSELEEYFRKRVDEEKRRH